MSFLDNKIDLCVPPIDPWIIEETRKMAQEKQKREKAKRRKQWWRDNIVGVISALIGLIGLIPVILSVAHII